MSRQHKKHNKINAFDNRKKPFMVSPRTPLPALCISDGARPLQACLASAGAPEEQAPSSNALPDVYPRASLFRVQRKTKNKNKKNRAQIPKKPSAPGGRDSVTLLSFPGPEGRDSNITPSRPQTNLSAYKTKAPFHTITPWKRLSQQNQTKRNT